MEIKEFDYKKYEQRRIRDDAILRDVEKSNAEWKVGKYSEEQILCAQEEVGKDAINAYYDEVVFPVINNILFVVYYVLELFTLPLMYYNPKELSVIVPVLGYIGLIISWIVLVKITKLIPKRAIKKRKWMCCLEKFSTKNTILANDLASIGYMLTIIKRFEFWYIYIIMFFAFIIGIYFDILKPLLKRKG